MFFKDFVSVKRQKIKRGASQTYDTPSRQLQFEGKIWQDKHGAMRAINILNQQ